MVKMELEIRKYMLVVLQTKNKTHLFYINKDENNENVVKRIIDCIFEYEELNGYTFYAHN